MRKRLRKKKRIGEFAQLGFYIYGVLPPDIDKSELDDFFERWSNVCVALQVVPTIAYWRPDCFESFFCPIKGSCVEFHRKAIASWLDKDPYVKGYTLGPMIDAWHDPTFKDYVKHGHPEREPVSVFWLPARRYWDICRPASFNAVAAWGIGSVAVHGSPAERMEAERRRKPGLDT